MSDTPPSDEIDHDLALLLEPDLDKTIAACCEENTPASVLTAFALTLARRLLAARGATDERMAEIRLAAELELRGKSGRAPYLASKDLEEDVAKVTAGPRLMLEAIGATCEMVALELMGTLRELHMVEETPEPAAPAEGGDGA